MGVARLLGCSECFGVRGERGIGVAVLFGHEVQWVSASAHYVGSDAVDFDAFGVRPAMARVSPVCSAAASASVCGASAESASPRCFGHEAQWMSALASYVGPDAVDVDAFGGW
jgi:hypothetical protein